MLPDASRGVFSGGRDVPAEEGILLSRLTDRPLRPLFPKGFYNEVQIALTALSVDGQNQMVILAINAASAALMISGAPFEGPVGAVRIGLIDGELIVNPTTDQMEVSKLDLRVAGTEDAIIMVEAGADEVDEAIILDGPAFGSPVNAKLDRSPETDGSPGGQAAYGLRVGDRAGRSSDGCGIVASGTDCPCSRRQQGRERHGHQPGAQ